jgi:hypothetical protein
LLPHNSEPFDSHLLDKNTKIINIPCYFVWVWNLAVHVLLCTYFRQRLQKYWKGVAGIVTVLPPA